ncbi:DUF6705 family protein [Lacinutrix iliipiscaria]|uniref:DUF6705 family protein n=1 Tax=Lacinutrix iliipiscaria TaxID=1230532 RepID=A0ABW5WNX3_9FLAO
MKNLIYLIALLIGITSCRAQEVVNLNTLNQGNNENKYFKDLDNNFTPFIGIWQYQNGNQIFRITLWKVEMVESKNGIKPSYFKDRINGHYEIIEVNTFGEETVIKTSNKNIKNSTTPYLPVITGGSIDGTNLGGSILDNTVDDSSRFSAFGIEGGFTFQIIPSTTPLQANWSCDIRNSLQLSDYPTVFSFPNNITLTKME